jgi:hypothetical protein
LAILEFLTDDRYCFVPVACAGEERESDAMCAGRFE